MRVNRQEFLMRLEAVAPGIAPRETVDQSTCFVFKDGDVLTYNEEVACRTPCGADFEGAVHAAPLVALLGKLTEEEVDVDLGDGVLVVKGQHHRKAGVRMEADVLLPYANVEQPADDRWRPCHEDLMEAIEVAVQCVAAKADGAGGFALTCIHIHPEFVESCDNFQMTRFPLPTGVGKPMLVRGEAIKAATKLDMSEMSITKNWFHLRNAAGLTFSVRRYLDEFIDLGHHLTVTGQAVTLPPGLADAVDKATVFTEDSPEKQVLVELRPGKLRLKGEGARGWYTEQKQVNYNGPPIAFLIAPKLLTEIVKRHSDCTIAKGKLLVDAGRFTYLSVLGAMDDDE